MLTQINPSFSDEINRQSTAINKRREQLRRWEQSETNRQSSHLKNSQRVQFQQTYVFLAACAAADQHEIDYLLQNGVDINTANVDGLTALHQASIDNNLHMVEYLINKNADINCQDNEGWTPLHASVSCANIDVVKYLLSHGAIVDICNNDGQLPIDVAEDDEIIVYLKSDMKRKGIDDQQSRNYEHQLMIKHAQDLFCNKINGLKTLIDASVHPRTGASSLHVAASKGYLDVVDLLVRAGANLNSVDNEGWTPLHAAAHWDKHDVIKYLVEHHANLDVKSNDGQTPFDVCEGETLELLKKLKEQQIFFKHPPANTFVQKSMSIEQTDDKSINSNPKTLKENVNIDNESLLSNPLINSSNLNDRKTKKVLSDLQMNTNVCLSQSENKSSLSNTHKIFTNPLQSLTRTNFNNNHLSYRDLSSSSSSTYHQSLDSKQNQRWGTNDRTVNESTTNPLPYVRRRSGINLSPSTVVSVMSCQPPVAPNITVAMSSNSPDESSNGKKRLSRDEEAEAQRKHRSAQARRERRSTQGITIEDIKAAEQQIQNRVNQNNGHDFESEHLHKVIQDKRDLMKKTNGQDQEINNEIRYRFTPMDDAPTITANDSLNLLDLQQTRRRAIRVHSQRKNTGKMIWNDETKQIEIRNDQNKIENVEEKNSSMSQFDNKSNESTPKAAQSTTSHLHEEMKLKIDQLNNKIIRLEKELFERDQIIEKFKTSQYIESSFDKREKRIYERRITEIEEELKKFETIKADNSRLKEENAALIRVISKLSK